jgi:3-hydroxyacyl-CoA dehydrogenase/enoyl-CoA hydratase/3-hydroxybutyryl-CoA epimerase
MNTVHPAAQALDAAPAAAWTHWRLSRADDGIAWLVFDCPGVSVNALSHHALTELTDILNVLSRQPPKGLIITSGKADSFVVGADVSAFESFDDRQNAHGFVVAGWHAFDRLAQVPYPTLALVRGACLGGGLELALACRYCIAVEHPRTTLGLPEVMLGIFPGWGGMRRLPARVGAPMALDMMLSGRNLDASRAVRAGLVDLKVPARLAQASAQRHVVSGAPPRRAVGLGRWLNTGPLRAIAARQARQRVKQRDPHGHYPAPLAIIDMWQRHDGNPLAAPEHVDHLLASPVARNLFRVFHLQERLKRLGKPAVGAQAAAPIARVHVVGAGTMGGDIAAWCALKGLTVTLQDTDSTRVAQAQGRAHALFKRRLRDPLAARAAFDRLVPDPQGDGIGLADLVIEAIVEDVQAKRALYRSIEPRLRVDAVLASNTSSIPLSALVSVLRVPERLVGIHFFNPVARMPLVEIVAATTSGPAFIAQAQQFVGAALGKLPLPVHDTPGFLVNAVLAPYLLEAMRCVDEGMAPAAIDGAMLAYGMPMGPLELADKVGLDVVRAAGETLAPDAQPPAALTSRLAQGHKGEKTEQGFYSWRGGKAIKKQKGGRDVMLARRLLQPLWAQAQKQLDLNVVADADLVDAAMIFGAGYAPFTGGPLHSQNASLDHASLPESVKRLP